MAKDAELIKTKDEDEETPYVEVDARGQPVGGDPSLLEVEDDPDGAVDDERTSLDAQDDRERRGKETTGQRRERQRRAQAAKDRRIEALERERDQLHGRLTNLERRGTAQDLGTIDARLEQAKRAFGQAERALAEALARPPAEGGPAAAVQALRVRDEARDEFHRMSGLKQRAANERADPGDGERPAALPPRVQRYVDDFKRKHTWYDPDGGDQDSKIVLALDAALAEEGYEADTQEYWDELGKRIRTQLPGKFKRSARDADESGGGRREARPGPRLSGGGDGNGADRVPAGFAKITPERKAALIEAGKWDDPKKRARALKSYATYDKEHAGEGAR